jgi:hypothetical protein
MPPIMKLLPHQLTKESTMATATKKCTRCSKRRKVENFYKDKTIKDGLSSWCKPCTRDYDREYAKRKKAAKATA